MEKKIIAPDHIPDSGDTIKQTNKHTNTLVPKTVNWRNLTFGICYFYCHKLIIFSVIKFYDMCYNNHYCSCEVVDNQMYGSLNCLQVKIEHAFGKLLTCVSM